MKLSCVKRGLSWLIIPKLDRGKLYAYVYMSLTNCSIFVCQQCGLLMLGVWTLNSLFLNHNFCAFISLGGLRVTRCESLVNRKPPRVVMMRIDDDQDVRALHLSYYSFFFCFLGSLNCLNCAYINLWMRKTMKRQTRTRPTLMMRIARTLMMRST
jgi:hypothetical protein